MSKLSATVAIIFLAAGVQARPPQSVQDFNERGLQRYARSDYDGAIADFTRAIELSSRLATKSAAGRNKWSAAVSSREEADRVRVIDPRTALTYTNRGIAHMAKGEADAAIGDFNRAIAISPYLAQAYNGRGSSRRAKNDYDGATADYDMAIRLESGYAEPYHNRGNARLDRGDLKGALADYDTAVRLDPRRAEFYYSRGEARRLAGDAAGAAADFERAISLAPLLAAAYNGRGAVLFGRGKLRARSKTSAGL